MALPSSGPIWMSQIQTEFAGPNYWMSTYYRGGGYTTTNNLNVPASGAIWFSQFHGGVRATGGSGSWWPGNYGFYVPPYQWITIDVRGGGGGGGGANIDVWAGSAGASGGNSEVVGAGTHIVAGGGAGGQGSNYYAGVNYDGNGDPRAPDGGGNYGAGGGYGGNGGAYGYTHGQRGGYGGRAVYTYYPGQLAVGGYMAINVGGGGAPGGGGTSGIEGGGSGAIYISWG